MLKKEYLKLFFDRSFSNLTKVYLIYTTVSPTSIQFTIKIGNTEDKPALIAPKTNTEAVYFPTRGSRV